MKKFISIFTTITLSFYALVSFISFLPNPATWDTGGRAAFVVFDLAFIFSYFMIQEASVNNKA